jgi:hypothetical protein
MRTLVHKSKSASIRTEDRVVAFSNPARIGSLLLVLWIALPPTGSTALAEKVTECTVDAFCYCVDSELRGMITQKVEYARTLIANEKANGKAVGYLSIPISTVGGAYFNVNVRVAAQVKERVENRLGVHAAWLLNTAGKDGALPPNATGADYMLMWTKVLEGDDGLGALDFIYFVGPSDFARYFELDGTADMEKLESYYDSLAKTDPGLKDIDKRTFRDYYALRASVSYSYGSHDEWNIVRAINQKRREADAKSGISKQMGVFFDGKPLSPGLFEAPVANGNAGACRN